MAAGTSRAGSRRRVVRALALAGIGLLYALSIPWYRREGEPGLLFGLPDWVAVAVGCYVGAAVLNAVAWLATDIPDAPPPDDEGGG